MPGCRSAQRGLTLLELTLVVTLVGIVGAFGYQTYQGHIQRVRENQALTEINMMSIQLQRWSTATFRLPETLAEAGLDGNLDPWGRPYEYLNVATAKTNEVRKDKNLHPLNTDFDLYSRGPDGATQLPLTAKASRDDIIRANNGSYVGRAEDY
jgi:general secretion pathway protein G